MKYSALILLLTFSRLLCANDFADYKNHVAKDRVILIFNKNVSETRKAKILRSTEIVSRFTHLPAPAITICMVTSYEEARKFFVTFPEICFISFFITDGKHYAGVLDDFFIKIKDKNFEPLLREKLLGENMGEAVPDKYVPNLYKVRCSLNAASASGMGRTGNAQDGQKTMALCESLSAEGWVEYAAPNYLVNPLVSTNDIYYIRQWSIANTGSALQGHGTPDSDMDVDSAWTISTGDSVIKVAIIDSGVDTLHPDLKQNLLPGHDAVNDSTDGYPTPGFPNDGHGTCCAGIVAAVKDNAQGIAGVAPSCKIIPVRAFYYLQISAPPSDPVPFSTADMFSNAIGWSWDTAKADILSNSWGLPASLIGLLPGGMQPVDDAIRIAHQSGRGGKGVAMFFSSGNEEDNSGPIWPGKLNETIAVNATSMCDQRKNANDCSGEDWSGNWGNGLDFSAPGVKIATTDMLGANGFSSLNYTFTFNGTSAACPNAAAVGALLLSVRPDLGAEDVRNVIAQSCDKVGGYAYDSLFLNGTWSRELGYGRVNAYQALLHAYEYTSVKSGTGEMSLNIFPNPARDIINFQNSWNRNLVIKIYDLTGKELLQKEITSGINSLNVANLSSGIYLVRVEGIERSLTKKITIIR